MKKRKGGAALEWIGSHMWEILLAAILIGVAFLFFSDRILGAFGNFMSVFEEVVASYIPGYDLLKGFFEFVG